MTDGASRTALGTALMRAAHTRLDRPRLLDDPWGDVLVGADEKAAIHARILAAADAGTRARLAALGSAETVIDVVLRRHPTYPGVILRSRCAEDALADAVARGVGQYVLLGAGFDSFILRQPDFARRLTIFEVDQPATQAMKRRRLAECGIAVPENVRFVAADLAAEPLAAALARGGFAADVPAFFSWLGVTAYLTRAANEATLAAIAAAAAPGSEVVFTYVDARVFDAGSALFDRMRADRAAEGEPWLSGFDPTTLAADLRALGLELVEDLDGAALAARWCAGRTDGVVPGGAGRVARARVPQRGGA
jgi:methyltransferase (TIGR00027 family)